jgi:hypothetical protein
MKEKCTTNWDPILPDFPGIVLVLWVLKSSVPVPVSHRIWFRAPYVLGFSIS